MQSLVSVIVPVYNVEAYLARCLNSLCRQSLSNIEILLIDDASTDRCGEICEEYAKNDSRFRVFHNNTNQGLSAARNKGIKYASSNYLMFVDSDDWVHEDFCKEPYECAIKQQADLVMFRYVRVEKTLPCSCYHDNNNKASTSGYKTQLDAIDLLYNNTVGHAAWDKLYSKKLFQDIAFPVGFLCEDIGTIYKVVLKALMIYYLDKVLYYYFRNANSITERNKERLWRDWCTMSIQQYFDLVAWGYPTDKLIILLNDIAMNYCIKKKPEANDRNYVFCKEVLLANKRIPIVFSWKRKIMFILFKYFRPIFEFICILLNRKVC